jgi:SAM-dependent methyltransferase
MVARLVCQALVNTSGSWEGQVVSQDRQDHPGAGQAPSLPTAAGFEEGFSAIAASPGIRRVWQTVDPDLPPQIEPFSFVSVDLLGHVAHALALSPGQTLVDLGCGRGGPGLWLAQSQGASLIGVDFSAVAVQQASERASLFGLAEEARFVVGDLAATGLAAATADAVVSIDALHFAAERTSRSPGCRTRRASGSRSRDSLTGSWSLPSVPLVESQPVLPASPPGLLFAALVGARLARP